MEPQIIDYYNEEPLIMKIVGNLNSQFSELKKEYYILKKEFGKFLSMISLGGRLRWCDILSSPDDRLDHHRSRRTAKRSIDN